MPLFRYCTIGECCAIVGHHTIVEHHAIIEHYMVAKHYAFVKCHINVEHCTIIKHYVIVKWYALHLAPCTVYCALHYTLCFFARLCLCTIVPHQLTINHLYISILLYCTLSGYTYTYWNYTNLSIKLYYILKVYVA